MKRLVWLVQALKVGVRLGGVWYDFYFNCKSTMPSTAGTTSPSPRGCYCHKTARVGIPEFGIKFSVHHVEHHSSGIQLRKGRR